MKTLSKILIAIGIIFGVFGVISYLQDTTYVKASVVVKATVISAEVIPNPWKAVGSTHLVLTYMRDGLTDSIVHNYSEVYSKSKPLPTEEVLKTAPYYVRYVPEEKRSKTTPNWVIVNNNGAFEGFYGQTAFRQMFAFILMGFMISMFGRKRL